MASEPEADRLQGLFQYVFATQLLQSYYTVIIHLLEGVEGAGLRGVLGPRKGVR